MTASNGSECTAEPLSFDEVMQTTRALRRRFDLTRPVDLAVVADCIELAQQAPSGSNRAGWSFVIVQDEALRARLGEHYRAGFEQYRARPGSVFDRSELTYANAGRQGRIAASVEYLAENIGRVPLHVIPCIAGRLTAEAPASARAAFMASIIPAAWSFMLACRSRGLGSCWTTMHLYREREVADILDIPYDNETQIALIPVGHTTPGPFRAVDRPPASTVMHIDRWGPSLDSRLSSAEIEDRPHSP